MYIRFRDHKQEALCNSLTLLSRTYGHHNAQKIIKRLYHFKTADSLNDVAFGRPHELTWTRKWIFAIDLSHPFRLLFKPLPPYDGKNRNTMTHIEIIDIAVDYH